jgi:protein TonB
MRALLLDRIRIVAIALAGIAVVALIAWLLHSLLKSQPVSQKRAQQITLVRPPPPPPPPKQEPPPPPKQEALKLKEPPKADEPKATNDAPLKPLGIDAEATGTGDGFGLAANKGGRDITAVTPSVNRPMAALQRSVYTDALQRHVQQVLARQDAMRLVDHRTYIDIWIGRDGSVQRAELAGSSAVRDPATLQALESALAALAGTQPREVPPEGLAMPIRVRLLNRGTG